MLQRCNPRFECSIILVDLTSNSLAYPSVMQDLSSLGITALGPRRKIVCAIQELRNPAPTAQRIAAMQESQRLSASVVVSSVDTLQGNITITSAFIMSVELCRVLKFWKIVVSTHTHYIRVAFPAIPLSFAYLYLHF